MSGSILHFPMSLRGEASNGMSHVRFGIDNRGEPTECDAIHLFVPQGFSVPDAAGYGTMDLGLIGAGMNADNLQASDLVARGAQAGTLVDAQFGSLGVGAATGGAAALQQGIAINPYTDTTFTNTNIRSFGFTFKLVSESADEADMASIIENVFRKYLYPEKTGAASLKYPAKFDITFYNGGNINKYMPKILPAYLVNFNTVYNSTTNAFHEDGQPVEIDLTLTFQETRPLQRGDLYPEGATDMNIGYLDGDTIKKQKEKEEDE